MLPDSALEVGAHRVEVIAISTARRFGCDNRWSEAITPAEVIDALASGTAIAIDERMNADQLAVDIGAHIEDLFGKISPASFVEPAVQLFNATVDYPEKAGNFLIYLVNRGTTIMTKGDVIVDCGSRGATQEASKLWKETTKEGAMDAKKHRQRERAFRSVAAKEKRHIGLCFELEFGRRWRHFKVVVPVSPDEWWQWR